MPVVPNTGPRKPTYARQSSRFNQETRQLHKSPPEYENPAVTVKEVLYSYQGHPLVDDESSPYMVRDPEAIITGVYLACRTAPTQDSTFLVKVNGAVIYTVTWPAGDTLVVEDALNLEVGEYDLITVVFTVSGNFLADVVAHIGYQIIQG